MLYYDIQHITTFHYSSPVYESLMELRMQPRSDDAQQCLSFELDLRPKANISHYLDYRGNWVHTFNLPGDHSRLVIKASAVVVIRPATAFPTALPEASWAAIDALRHEPEFLDYLLPSRFTQPSSLLSAFAAELAVKRSADPLTTLTALNQQLHQAFRYVPESTQVDSPIDLVLTTREGVCQDYTHVMLALTRELGIPARYVSGYLYHRPDAKDTSAEDATHAWMEAYLPTLGWVGFDPTNAVLTGDRHIRVAMGQDYGSVPPTHGVFKGTAETKLTVRVGVRQLSKPPRQEDLPVPVPGFELPSDEPAKTPSSRRADLLAQQQQQQQ